MLFIQILATLTGVVSIYYTVKQNILCWLFGIISNVLLFYYFYNIELYGQTLYQIVSITQCIVGWYYWKHKETHEITKLSNKHYWSLFIVSCIVGSVFGLYIDNFSILSSYDGMTLSLGILAVILLILKKIDSWFIYMIMNILTIIICIYKGVYGVAILNVLYFVMSIWGYKEWKKDLIKD